MIARYSKYYLSIINKIRSREKIKKNPSIVKPKTKPYQFKDVYNVPTQQQIQERKEHLTPYELYLIETKSLQRPYTGSLWGQVSPGFYHCVTCNTRLFSFDQKIDHKNQHTGLPSFYDCVEKRVEIVEQKVNIETTNLPTNDPFILKNNRDHKRCQCRQCKMHLGALFFDGPFPTFLRFSINSPLLRFVDLENFTDPTVQKKKRIAYYQSLKVRYLR